MQAQYLGDLLDALCALDKRLELHYADIRDRATGDSAKMLTYHLCRLCRHLRQHAAATNKDVFERLRQEQVTSDPSPEAAFAQVLQLPPAAATAGQLTAAAIAHSEALLRLYRGLLKQQLSRHAADFLSSLLLLEERELLRLHKLAKVNEFLG